MSQKSRYTPELGAAICERLSQGTPLLRIAEEIGIPLSTCRQWEIDIPEHAANSTRARELGCHALAEECLDIADDARNDWMAQNGEDDAGWKQNGEHVQRSRLRIDTRLRLIGKWHSKVYGDKQQIEHSGTVSIAEAMRAAKERRKAE